MKRIISSLLIGPLVFLGVCAPSLFHAAMADGIRDGHHEVSHNVHFHGQDDPMECCDGHGMSQTCLFSQAKSRDGGWGVKALDSKLDAQTSPAPVNFVLSSKVSPLKHHGFTLRSVIRLE